ncbi:MAG TPA: META domain-containing protein [Vicinamibacteria bacterium]|nr:META domain-containing protein [Vicinamibacteria bacterium]
MRTVLLLSLAAILSGCETSTSASIDEAALPQGVWALQAFELSRGQFVTVPDPSQYTLELAEDGALHARTDCNLCNGTYQVSGSHLSIGLLACTRAACRQGSLEGPYVDALGSATSWELAGDELTIRYEGGRMRFGRL